MSVKVRTKSCFSAFAVDPAQSDGGTPEDRKNDPENDAVQNGLQAQFLQLFTAQVGSDQKQRRDHQEFGNILHKLSPFDDAFADPLFSTNRQGGSGHHR